MYVGFQVSFLFYLVQIEILVFVTLCHSNNFTISFFLKSAAMM
jgi:hypothetical protein